MKLKEYCCKAILGITIGGALLTAPGLPMLFSERIRDGNHLNQIIDEEKEKIGLKEMRIEGITNFRGNLVKRSLVPAYACRLKGPSITWSDGRIEGGQEYGLIVIKSQVGMRRGIVKHELSHIANKDEGWKGLKYWTHGEFLANLYGGLNIKI
jgi:hypothetical protein